MNDEWLSGATDARKAEIDAELNEVDADRNRLTAEQAREGAEQDLAQAEVDAAQTRADALTKQVADLKAQLAECEKQCAPADDGGAVALPDPSPFVTTDCPPCETLASSLNDVVGSILTTEKNLAAAQAVLEPLRAEIATKRATKSAAQDAFAAALVEKSRLGAAGQDGSLQQAIADDQIKRPSDLLTDLEELEFEERDLAERAEDVSTTLAQLRQREAKLRNDLVECEKQCGVPGPAAAVDESEDTGLGFDPDLILEKLQPEQCQGGSDCTFEIGATNGGAATYRGPLILRESSSVAAGGNGAVFGDWHCSPAANGRSICLTNTEVASGQTVTLRVPIRLPGYVAPGNPELRRCHRRGRCALVGPTGSGRPRGGRLQSRRRRRMARSAHECGNLGIRKRVGSGARSARYGSDLYGVVRHAPPVRKGSATQSSWSILSLRNV